MDQLHRSAGQPQSVAASLAIVGIARALSCATKEAKASEHVSIGTPQLLIGVLASSTREGVAGKVLEHFGVTVQAVRRAIATASVEQLPKLTPDERRRDSGLYTIEAKAALELSRKHALRVGHYRVWDGHLVLGIMERDVHVGVQILASLGVQLESLRDEITKALDRLQQATSSMDWLSDEAKYADQQPQLTAEEELGLGNMLAAGHEAMMAHRAEGVGLDPGVAERYVHASTRLYEANLRLAVEVAADYARQNNHAGRVFDCAEQTLRWASCEFDWRTNQPFAAYATSQMRQGVRRCLSLT